MRTAQRIMLGFRNQPHRNRVVVDVGGLLLEECRAEDQLRMVRLLPEHKCCILCGPCCVLAEHGHHPFTTALTPVRHDGFHDPFRGEALHIAQYIGQQALLPPGDEVDMAGHDHVFEDLQVFVLSAVFKAINQYVHIFRSNEDIDPAYRGEGDEVSSLHHIGLHEFRHDGIGTGQRP